VSVLRKIIKYRRALLTGFRPLAASDNTGKFFPFKRRAIEMTKLEIYATYHDYFEYQGGTTIKRIRKKAGKTIWLDWLIFDTVEAALEYFNDCCEV
jgi:hypothetical protein